MSNIVHSDIKPINRIGDDFLDVFKELANRADSISIASGYISTDSVAELKWYVERLEISHCELLVGMHHFEGITKPQYNALESLNSSLHLANQGEVSIFTAFPFHGKMYIFQKEQANIAAILGSSNLSVLQPKRQFEVDFVLTSAQDLEAVSSLYQDLKRKATKPFNSWEPEGFKQPDNPLDGIDGVTKCQPSELNTKWSSAEQVSFALPVKTTKKSNLNIYHGKGRLNTKTGVVRPRPWYEAEIIVSNSITRQPGYPVPLGHCCDLSRPDLCKSRNMPKENRRRVITVYTDDGWSFDLSPEGDDHKDLRSAGALTTLGAWMKGRMEVAGALKPGDLVTDETLRAYGRNTVDLISTSRPDEWLLDFEVK